MGSRGTGRGGERRRAVGPSDPGEQPLPHKEFGFVLDVCAKPATATCARYFTVEDDGLIQGWGAGPCWMNPPYSNIGPWVEKESRTAQQGGTVVALVPLVSSPA
jgi:phage N-6-adenine-methyltransferase